MMEPLSPVTKIGLLKTNKRAKETTELVPNNKEPILDGLPIEVLGS